MKHFTTTTEIPPDSVAAPTAYTVPRSYAPCVGVFRGQTFYHRNDTEQLRTVAEWRLLGRNVKLGEKPLAYRGLDREPGFAK